MTLFAFLFAAVIICGMIVPLRLGWHWKVLLALPVLAASFKFQLTRLFGGPMFFAPELPGWVLPVSGWCYAVVFLLFFLVLGKELVMLALLLCKVKLPPTLPPLLNLGLLAVSLILATAGVWKGIALPKVREIELSLPVPPSADGMKIAVLADLHMDAWSRAERLERIVARTNALSPDLIVIVGDFVDGTVAKLAGELEPLRALSAPLGVFGVPGNHEYYSGYTDWMLHIPSLGVSMLFNENRELANGIVLAGVTDPAAGRTGEMPPDVTMALEGVPREKFTILLSHQPALAKTAAEQGVDLQFSGHTHGGMVWGLDRLVARFNGGFHSGEYRVGRMLLYVSNGSSIWNGFPVRLGHPSEITLVRLRRKSAVE